MSNSVLISFLNEKCLRVLNTDNIQTANELKCMLLHVSCQEETCLDSVYLICNGKLLSDESKVESGKIYHVVPRLPGGKGGFGSMLRAIGAQIEKTTNREALRDLSGRRMRDVNNEKKLKEWLGKESEREAERDKKREERRARRRAEPRHKFDDPTYEKQKSQVLDNLDDAIQEGLQRAQSKLSSSAASVSPAVPGGSGISTKRKADSRESGIPSKVMKDTEWLGIDVEDLSDSESEEEQGARASPTAAQTSSSSSDSQGHSDSESSISKDFNSDVCNAGTSTSETNELKRVKPFGLEESSDPKGLCMEDPVSKNCGDNQQEPDKGSEMCSGNEQEENCSAKDSAVIKHGLLTALEAVTGSNHGNQNDLPEIAQEMGPINLEDFDSVESIEALGLDRLKSELLSRGLKCGGTLQQRAERLYSVKGLSRDEIDPSLFAKPANGKGKKKN